MARRDEWLRRAAGSERWVAPWGRRWRRAAALLVGWLVVMTVWGVGRSGFPDHVGWFLAVGLAAGAITSIVLWRRR